MQLGDMLECGGEIVLMAELLGAMQAIWRSNSCAITFSVGFIKTPLTVSVQLGLMVESDAELDSIQFFCVNPNFRVLPILLIFYF